MDDKNQQQIFQAMENPLLYPHPVSGIHRKETHISKVFLAGKYVYKIKKALNLGFLDFSTLEKRHYYCCREVALNRRLSRGVYLDVVPITREKGKVILGGNGQPVEFAVRMHRLPDANSLQNRMVSGEIGRMEMVALGRKLAEFHHETPVSKLAHADGGWQNVYDACKENFRQTTESCGTQLEKDVWETVQGATLSFLNHHRSLFERRYRQGKVRDCHGDLRSDHIYFTQNGLQVIDCIEFNDGLRHIDVISDLGFLLMDLDSKGKSEPADCLLDEYMHQTDDLNAFSLLSFYKCYRAMVRCKINCILLQSKNIHKKERRLSHLKAVQYLDLAFHYALQFAVPRIWVVCGKPATGKSTTAKALARVLGIDVIRSDIVRKKMFGLPPHESGIKVYGEKLYSSSADALTYGKMLRLAGESIDAGGGVILDATYSRVKNRREVVSLAGDKGIKPVFVECSAPDRLIKERLRERRFKPSVSDAGIDDFEMLNARYTQFKSTGNALLHIHVDTSRPLKEVLSQILVQAFSAGSQPLGDIDRAGAGRII